MRLLKKIVGTILISLFLLVSFSSCISSDSIDEFEVTNDETKNNNVVTVSSSQSNINFEELNYDSSPSIKLNNNEPFFSEEQKSDLSEFELYSDLDSLGRCGVAFANICINSMPTESRGEIGEIKPSGWVQQKYEGIVDSDPPYLYNRCHLIGFQLAGENANEKNLITGTRYFNIDGMLPYENMVSDYVKETENHVLYRVTPYFKDKNLVASGVEIEAYSIEDQGEGICFNVYCFNVQPGIIIDYEDGTSCEDEDYIQQIEQVDESNADYVVNKNTKKFHLISCESVNDIKEYNKEYFCGTREELIDQGYTPCKLCNP